MNDEYELYHYGVLGMKWGVRKNPAKAYAKSVRKKQALERNVKYTKRRRANSEQALDEARDRYNKSQNDLMVKTAKLKLATDDYNHRSYKQSIGWATTGSVERAAKRRERARIDYEDAGNKVSRNILDVDYREKEVNRWAYKAERAMAKSKRWNTLMDKTFANVSQEDIEAGKALLEKRSRKR